jgi:hypothetical protein
VRGARPEIVYAPPAPVTALGSPGSSCPFSAIVSTNTVTPASAPSLTSQLPSRSTSSKAVPLTLAGRQLPRSRSATVPPAGRVKVRKQPYVSRLATEQVQPGRAASRTLPAPAGTFAIV